MYVGSDYFIIITNVCVYRRTVEGKNSPDEKNHRKKNITQKHTTTVFSAGNVIKLTTLILRKLQNSFQMS